jgi:undecaprenyl-diphosphatase
MAKAFKSWLNWEIKDLLNRFYTYPKRKFLFLFLGIFLGFWAIFNLWLVIDSGTLNDFGDSIIRNIASIKAPFLDKFFFFITQFGSRDFIVLSFMVLATFLFAKRRRRAAATVFFTLVGSFLAIYLLKENFNRLRPSGCGLNDPSFPSAHAALSFYFYGTLFSLATRFVKLKWREVLALGTGLGLLILLIAFSRVYLGCHYPSDILGGFILGGIWVLAAAILIDFLYQK